MIATLRLFCLYLLCSLGAVYGQAWLGSEQSGNEARFLFTNRIEHYDLTTQTWLTPITLPRSGAVSMASDSQGAVVAYGTSIYRYDTSFGGESLVATSTGAVQSVFLDGNLVIVVSLQTPFTYLTTFDRTTGATISSRGNSPFVGVSHAKGINYLYGRSAGASGLILATYSDDGTITNVVDPGGATGYPNATKTWVFPNEERVVDSSGTVYSTNNPTHLGDFGGAILDIAFSNGIPVVLRNNQLSLYNKALQQIGSLGIVAPNAAKIYINGPSVYVFSPTQQGAPSVVSAPLSGLNLGAASAPVNPAGLAYDITSAMRDKDGTLLLFSAPDYSIFRWSPDTRSYGNTILLSHYSNTAVYSAGSERVYFGSQFGAIRALDLTHDSLGDVDFVAGPLNPSALSATDSLVVAADYDGRQYVYNTAGVNLSTSGYNPFNVYAFMQWDAARQRMYFFSGYGGQLSNLASKIYNADGTSSGYVSSQVSANGNNAPPIRFNEDGTKIATGGGSIYGTANNALTQIGTLQYRVTDALWKSGKLFTIRSVSTGTEVGTWETVNYTPGAVTRQLLGNPVAMFDVPEGELVVTSVNRVPRFYILDAALNQVYVSPYAPVAPGGLATTGRTADSVSLQWQDLSDNEDGFRVEYQTGSSTWTTGATVAAGQTSATVTGLSYSTIYQFRVIAFSGGLDSTPSATVSNTTLASPEVPIGEPYQLAATRVYSNQITLGWLDNATNETGFLLYRSTNPSDAGSPITLPANTTSYDDTSLAPGKTYYYRIQAVNGSFLAELSSTLTVATPAGSSAPAAPGSLAGVSTSGGTVDLTWTDQSLNEDSFDIDRSPTGVNGSWQRVASLPYNTTHYQDTGLIPGNTYFYRVVATNVSGSGISSAVSVKSMNLGGDYAGYSMRAGNIYYFAFTGPNRIERYDLAAETWLTPVNLASAINALWVDSSGIYVGVGRRAYRYGFDGSGGGQIGILGNSQVPTDIGMMFSVNGVFCFGSLNSEFVAVNIQTGVQIATFSAPGAGSGPVVDPAQSRIYYRTINSVPASIATFTVSAAGAASKVINSPQMFNSLPDATRTFLFPDATKVLDNSGSIYAAGTLNYIGSMGGSFTDMSFTTTGQPLVLRGDSLVLYSNAYFPTATYQVGTGGQALAVSGTDAVTFVSDGTSTHGFTAKIVPLANLAPPVAGPAPDARGLAFVPDNVFVGSDGVVLLISKAQKAVFRWSPVTHDYLPALPLLDVPDFSGYSPSDNRLYFVNVAARTLCRMNLSDPQPVEQDFVNLPSTVYGFTMAGQFPYLSMPPGITTLSPDGVKLSNHNSFSTDYSSLNVWDPNLRRVYHLEDFQTPVTLNYDAVDANGDIVGAGQSNFELEGYPSKPIIISSDGTKAAAGNGSIYSTSPNPVKAGSISTGFTDGIFLDTRLATIYPQGNQTSIRWWNSSTGTSMGSVSRAFAGTPVRILPLSATSVLLVTNDRGMPHYFVMGSDLSVQYDFVPDAPRLYTTTPPPTATEDTAFSWTPDTWVLSAAQPGTFSSSDLPAWLHLDGNVLSGTPLEADSGDFLSQVRSYAFTLQLTDATGKSVTQSFSVDVHWVNDPPALVGPDTPYVADAKGSDVKIDAAAWLQDSDGNDPHQWRITGNSNPGIFSSATVDATGQLLFRFAPYVSGSSQVTVEVEDGSGVKASKVVTVTLPVQPLPAAGSASAITLNRVTGLYEQTITITNTAARAIGGFNVTVSGLRSGVVLYNGMTSGDGSGVLAYQQPLQAGQSVTLTLEYYTTQRGTIPQPVFTTSLSLPAAATVSTASSAGFAVDRMVKLADGSFILEFPSETGRKYQVEYSEDATTWKVCPYPIQAGGTRVQWIDRGPPWTDTAPASVTRRLYRIQSLPN